MTWFQQTTLGRFFARNDLSFLAPIPRHDTDLSPDVLTTITLNYRWRAFIAWQLSRLFDYNMEHADPLDWSVVEMFYLAMLADLYD